MFGPGMGRFFAEQTRIKPSVPVRARLERNGLSFEAMRLLWSTWSEMCDFANVGIDTEKLAIGVFLDHNGEITDSASGHLGLRIPLGPTSAMLATEGDWIVQASNGVLFPVPHAKLADLFDVIEMVDA